MWCISIVEREAGMEAQNGCSKRRGVSFLLGLLGLLATGGAQADRRRDAPPPDPTLTARRITITRREYGQAPPDEATIDLPFAVQGETWEAVEKQRSLLLSSLQQEIAPYDSSPNTVSVSSANSGQVLQDGKMFVTDTGIIRIYVHSLSHWKELLNALGKKNPKPLTVEYLVTETTTLSKAGEQAQKRAIVRARQDADRLAGLAGTRVIGVLTMREGPLTNEASFPQTFAKAASNALPQTMTAVSAEITITFELAAPAAFKPAVKAKHSYVSKTR
jgi:uncharacterized protein YggE